MKKNEVPQDKGNLAASNMKELVYATDEKGNYTTALSTGWEPKSIALANSIDDINERVSDALESVKSGKASPIAYFMEKSKMDVSILASYAGMWQWRVKRHLKPDIFKELSGKTLAKYASAFAISVSELKNFKG